MHDIFKPMYIQLLEVPLWDWGPCSAMEGKGKSPACLSVLCDFSPQINKYCWRLCRGFVCIATSAGTKMLFKFYVLNSTKFSSSVYVLMLWIITIHIFYRQNNLDKAEILRQICGGSESYHAWIIILDFSGGSCLKMMVQYDIVGQFSGGWMSFMCQSAQVRSGWWQSKLWCRTVRTRG